MLHRLTLRPIKSLLLIFMLLIVVSVTAAQEDDATAEPNAATSDTPPILELLALVPNKAQFTQDELIGFSDFRAQAAAREGTGAYTSWAEFQTARDAKEPAARRLFNAWGFSGFPGIDFMVDAGADMPVTVGFDFFDIDTALTFGRPPEQVQVFQGDFDAEQIDAALTANGYLSDELNGFNYWCPEAGCDTGTEINVEEVNLANPFGGELGRRFPIVMLDDALVASPNDANVELVAEVYQDEADSLADKPVYQTAVAAMYSSFDADGLNENALLRQATFVPPVFLMADDPLSFAIFEPDALEKIREQLESQNTASLPLYQLAAFTDFGSDEHQYVQVVLVYLSEADAQTAIDMIPKRIDSFDSISRRRPIAELIEERGAELLDPVVYADQNTGQYAAVFTFQYPLASNEPDEIGMVQQSSILYYLMTGLVYSADTLWLTPMLELPEAD